LHESRSDKGIVVSNVPDFCLGEKADHTMALLLAFGLRAGPWHAW